MEKEHLEVILESIDSKFNLVLEGYATLDEKFTRKIDELAKKTEERFDLVDFKIDTLNQKIDSVASDLKAHRNDTEAHHGIYRVKES